MWPLKQGLLSSICFKVIFFISCWQQKKKNYQWLDWWSTFIIPHRVCMGNQMVVCEIRWNNFVRILSKFQYFFVACRQWRSEHMTSLQRSSYFGVEINRFHAAILDCSWMLELVQRRGRGWGFPSPSTPPCPFFSLNPYSLGEYLLAPILKSWFQDGGLIRKCARAQNSSFSSNV